MNCTADCQTAKLKVGGRGVFWAVSAKRRGLAYIITQICKNISIDKTMGGYHEVRELCACRIPAVFSGCGGYARPAKVDTLPKSRHQGVSGADHKMDLRRRRK